MQAFLSSQYYDMGWVSIGIMGGMVGGVYAIERFVNARFFFESTPRHQCWRHVTWATHRTLIIIGGSVWLGIVGGWWLGLMPGVKWGYVGLLGLFICHVMGQRRAYYWRYKTMSVGIQFTAAMILPHMTLIPVSVVGMIGLYTWLNLMMHDWVETHAMWYSVTGVVMGMVGVMAYGDLPWVMWTVGIGLQLTIPMVHRTSRYWFEYGEVCFAIPFVIGYVGVGRV